MSEEQQQLPDDGRQMAIESVGDDAVGTSEDPADHPKPAPEEAGGRDETREPDPISDGDAVAGNPDSASDAEPDLPADVGPNAVPPANAESNEYDKE